MTLILFALDPYVGNITGQDQLRYYIDRIRYPLSSVKY